ncbi:hypothetical protein ALI144C_44855 [Actinosynnema sp. ALI-1.44]|uniref:hypothetical protein n=1 Tax=Actinosynnema sp. ALI-1.44 TaxID=1933779 RepID=UPI00097C6711|nr:hypothetical protein [Actinosynnema sp. ALI-1.44]ONI73084.1 hypothetical protein ALI144C_44855 [Actinosynnema sp. ALI-1.44]
MPANRKTATTPKLDEGQALTEPLAEVEEREPIPGEGLGRIAYDAYATAVDGTAVNGDQLPAWDQLAKDNTSVAAAWCASAQAVIAATWEGKKP